MRTARLLSLGLAMVGVGLVAADTMAIPSPAATTWKTLTIPLQPAGALGRLDYPSTGMPSEGPSEVKNERRAQTLLWSEHRSPDCRLFRLVSPVATRPESGEYLSIRTLLWSAAYPNGRSSGRHHRQCGRDPYHGWDTRINDPKLGCCSVLSHL